MIRRAVFLVFTLATRIAGAAAATPGDPVRESVAGTISRLDLQTALPHAAADDAATAHWDIHLPQGALWWLGALFAVILAYILRDMIPGWRRRGDDGWAEADRQGANGVPSAEAKLADADALALKGRFVEAMHLLLLNSLAELRRRLGTDFADSMTSREIVRRARLPEEGRAALRGIVTRVELSYFGGYPAARPDYDVCRIRYQELSEILARPAY